MSNVATPGPWTASLHSEYPGRDHEVVQAVPLEEQKQGAVGESIADVSGAGNAALIAAAPDLRKALSLLVGMIDNGTPPHPLDPAMDQARAALAQSEPEDFEDR